MISVQDSALMWIEDHRSELGALDWTLAATLDGRGLIRCSAGNVAGCCPMSAVLPGGPEHANTGGIGFLAKQHAVSIATAGRITDAADGAVKNDDPIRAALLEACGVNR